MEELRSQSLAESVFSVIEQGILSGEYPKGSLLSENALSKKLNVSRTPIREAISRLSQENLVKETPKGHVVTGVSAGDIADIYDIRIKIEGEATARCAVAITEGALNELEEVVDLQEFYTAKGEADKIKGTDNDFHRIIYENCGSEIYSAVLTTRHKKAQRYRKQSFASSERAKRAAAEHRAILDALKNRDAELARSLAIRHVENAKESIVNK